MKKWPQVGTKIKYNGVGTFWFNDLEETDNIVYSLNFFDYEA